VTHNVLIAAAGERASLRFIEKLLSDANDDHKIEVLCVCEMVANYCDLVLVTLETLEENERPHWQKFVENTLKKSPQLRAFIHKYRAWYSDKITNLL
jgi:hypothetical protein